MATRDQIKKSISKIIKEVRATGTSNPDNADLLDLPNGVTIGLENWEDVLWVSYLHSKNKGVGHAKQVIEMICTLADKHNVIIAASPHPFGEDTDRLNFDNLVKLYTKFSGNFGSRNYGLDYMERLPK
jgi:hypothetical protein